MSNLIKLLPDHISNQIAAGEVVQRPASIVKELLENSVDAGSTKIQLIVKDAGKRLVQVIDNGCGMSVTDARMSFERHATSKIRTSDDLIAIRTMGFRGEAMASIAAVAQVELRSKTHDAEIGICLTVENSKVISQEPCQQASGTNILVKNLFFNVPARRNFLKSDTVEFKHITDEFTRVALAFPDIQFSLYHNDREIYILPSTNLRQRIVHLLGNHANQKLIPLSEKTENISFYGFIGKPEGAKKTRGDQFFFVNNRYIKSNYLNHAVMAAYEGLLQSEYFPMYIIFLELNPQTIDINIHPTKQEVRFEDEKIIYNYLRAATRHALGQFQLQPQLDFEGEGPFSANVHPNIHSEDRSIESKYSATSNTSTNYKPEERSNAKVNLKNWSDLYKGLEKDDFEIFPEEEQMIVTASSKVSNDDQEEMDLFSSNKNQAKALMQLHNKYILCQTKVGLMIVHQVHAQERIFYEEFINGLTETPLAIQRELFPRTINLQPAEAEILKSVDDLLRKLGFEVEPFGTNTYVVQGVPAGLSTNQSTEQILMSFLEALKNNTYNEQDLKKKVAMSMAGASVRGKEQELTPIEMDNLIGRLFACSMPAYSPKGRKCYITYTHNDLNNLF